MREKFKATYKKQRIINVNTVVVCGKKKETLEYRKKRET